jgi:hypothetical protein
LAELSCAIAAAIEGRRCIDAGRSKSAPPVIGRAFGSCRRGGYRFGANCPFPRIGERTSCDLLNATALIFKRHTVHCGRLAMTEESAGIATLGPPNIRLTIRKAQTLASRCYGQRTLHQACPRKICVANIRPRSAAATAESVAIHNRDGTVNP